MSGGDVRENKSFTWPCSKGREGYEYKWNELQRGGKRRCSTLEICRYLVDDGW